MSHNFAPYQDSSPEAIRALSPPTSPRPSRIRSPPLKSPRASLEQTRRNIASAVPQHPRAGYFDEPSGWGGASSLTHNSRAEEDGWGASEGIERGWARDDEEAGTPGGGLGSGRPGGGWGIGGERDTVNLFRTRLGIRMDLEACLAYLVLPPAGGVLLLVLEHESDYVRFHAWQSSLLFAVVFIIHVIFSWSTIVSWILFAMDILLIGYLTFRAYKDADSLDRFEVPFFGPLASSILDDE